MQAITTYIMPATSLKGTRVKATCTRGHLVMPYDYGMNNQRNHKAVALALQRRFIEEDKHQAEGQHSGRGESLPPHYRSPWDLPMVNGHNSNGSQVWVLSERIRELTSQKRLAVQILTEYQAKDQVAHWSSLNIAASVQLETKIGGRQ